MILFFLFWGLLPRQLHLRQLRRILANSCFAQLIILEWAQLGFGLVDASVAARCLRRCRRADEEQPRPELDDVSKHDKVGT